MLNGIAYASVLGDALVCEVNLAFFVYCNVLQQCIAADCVVDVGLAFLVKVDNLGVAAAFEIEDAVVVPTMLVITYKQTLGVGGKGGFAGAAKTKEDGCILAFHIGVGRAVHSCDAFQRKVVVHH